MAGLFDRTKDEGLIANVRPGNLNVRGQQPTLFPFDAFEFTNPNDDPDSPLVRLKAPWEFEIDARSGDAASVTITALETAASNAQTTADNAVTYDELEGGYESGEALVAPTLAANFFQRTAFLEWDRQRNITNLAYYEVQRKKGGGSWEEVLGASDSYVVEAYRDAPTLDQVDGSPVSTTFTYRVRRVKADDAASDWSNEVSGALAPTTNADLAAGAVGRAQLDADFVSDHDQMVNEVYPLGTEADSAIVTLGAADTTLDGRITTLDDQVTPQIEKVELHSYDMEALIETVFGELTVAEDAILVRATEIDLIVGEVFEEGLGSGSRIQITSDQITSAVARIDDAETNISLVQQQADLIKQIVSEIDVGDGGTINISSITQTAQQIELIVSSGKYEDELGNQQDIYSQAQLEVLSDQIETFVADGTWGTDGEGNPLRAAVVNIYPDGFTAEVTEIADQSVVDSGLADEISEARSVIDVAADRALIASELSEAVEGELYSSLGWIEATGRRITLAVETLTSEDERLQSELTLTASEINAEVSSIDADLQASKASINVQDDAIRLLATQGLYDEDGTIIQSETLAGINVLAGKVELFATDGSWAGVGETAVEQNAAAIVTNAGSITLAVGRLDGHDVDISANGTLISLNRDLIALRAELLESVEDVAYRWSSGVEATARDIVLTAQEAEDGRVTLQTQITQNASEIVLVATNYAEADTALEGKLVARADLISASVTRVENDVQVNAAELLVQEQAISQRVIARVWDEDAEAWIVQQDAFMQLAVNRLPVLVGNEEMRSWVETLGGDTDILAVYEGSGTQDGGGYYDYYTVKGGASAGDITTLKGLLAPEGLLRTQFVVSAEDILFDGTVKMSHLDADEIFTVTVQSTDYDGAGTGWKIDRTGTFDLGAGVIRGAVQIGDGLRTADEVNDDIETAQTTADSKSKTHFLTAVPGAGLGADGDLAIAVIGGVVYHYKKVSGDWQSTGQFENGATDGMTDTNKDAVAQQLGYADWAAFEAVVAADTTIIADGLVRTTLVDTEALLAQVVSVTGTITATTGGAIRSASGDLVTEMSATNGFRTLYDGDPTFRVDPSTGDVYLGENGSLYFDTWEFLAYSYVPPTYGFSEQYTIATVGTNKTIGLHLSVYVAKTGLETVHIPVMAILDSTRTNVGTFQFEKRQGGTGLYSPDAVQFSYDNVTGVVSYWVRTSVNFTQGGTYYNLANVKLSGFLLVA